MNRSCRLLLLCCCALAAGLWLLIAVPCLVFDPREPACLIIPFSFYPWIYEVRFVLSVRVSLRSLVCAAIPNSSNR